MDALHVFTPLFAYPDGSYRDRALLCAAVTGSKEVRALAEAVAPLSTGQIQEAFI